MRAPGARSPQGGAAALFLAVTIVGSEGPAPTLPVTAAVWLPARAPRPTLASDTIEVVSNPLEGAALAFARALLDPSGDAVDGILGSGGIRLQLDAAAHAGLSSRQAVASLRDFLREYEGAQTAVTRAAPVAGSPDRGFAEVHWSARVAGTSQALRRVLFIGLVEISGEWRVDEIRFVP